MNRMRVPCLIFLGGVFMVFLFFTACKPKNSMDSESLNSQKTTSIPSSFPHPSISPGTNDPYQFSFAYEKLYETPLNSVNGLSSNEILLFLISKWLGEKTQTTIPEEKITDFLINSDIKLLDWEPQSGFLLVASVKFSVVPLQVPNNWGAILVETPEKGDVWWHLASSFGLENDGTNFILRNTAGWGT